MRLLLIALLLASVWSCTDANIFSSLLQKMREQILRVRAILVERIRAMHRAIVNVFYLIRHISHWRRAYVDKSIMIVSSGYIVDGQRLMTGFYLTRRSTRHILTSMEGMALAAAGLSEGYAKMLRREKINVQAQAKMREVLVAFVALDLSYKRSFSSGRVTFRGKTFSVAPNAGDAAIISALGNYIQSDVATQNKVISHLKHLIVHYKPNTDLIKKFIVEAATREGNRLVFTTEQHALKYLLFIYYRSFFLLNLQKVLVSKDGMNVEENMKKEKEFVKKVVEKTKVDETPPKKNPSEHKGKSVAGTISVTINGKKETVTLANAHQYVTSQSSDMKSNVVSLSDMLSKTASPNLIEVDGKTQAIRVNLHVCLTIYRFVREHQKQIMKVYTAMKKTVIDVFDYLGNTLRSEMERIEPPSEAVLQRVGPAIDAVNSLMPKLRAAYTKNVDDKTAFVEEYMKIYKDAATVINEEMKRLAKAKNQGKFMKVLALCRVIAKLQRSSYCVFSEQCKP